MCVCHRIWDLCLLKHFSKRRLGWESEAGESTGSRDQHARIVICIQILLPCHTERAALKRCCTSIFTKLAFSLKLCFPFPLQNWASSQLLVLSVLGWYLLFAPLVARTGFLHYLPSTTALWTTKEPWFFVSGAERCGSCMRRSFSVASFKYGCAYTEPPPQNISLPGAKAALLLPGIIALNKPAAWAFVRLTGQFIGISGTDLLYDCLFIKWDWTRLRGWLLLGESHEEGQRALVF